jgi:STE24 endopeptidase
MSGIWQKISSLTGEGFFRSDLAFIVAFLLLIQVLSFPSAIYFGHFRETAAGFANIGAGDWLLKHLKSVVVGVGFETAGIMLLLSVMRWFPGRWPVVLPLAMGSFALAVTILAPVVITPLFYNQQPLEPGPFRERLLDMAAKAGMKVEEIFFIDESRYSRHTNAYFTGIGRFRRIVLYDNLIKSHTPDEAALIFAHEAGHWRHNHVAWGLALGALGLLAAGFVYQLLFPAMAQVGWFGLGEVASAKNLPFLMILVTLLQLFVAPVESQISQLMERQADKVALELTGLRDVYRDAQIRLARDNRSDLIPHPLRVFWLYSHPPAVERIKAAF